MITIFGWVYDISILIGIILVAYLSRQYAFICLVLKMADKRRAMYDGFSDIVKHSAKCVMIIKEFLKLDFASDHREASCSCSRCENRMVLSEYEKGFMSNYLAKKRFMLNYLLWHQHVEVRPTVADVSDGNDVVDQIDDMVVDIGRRYDLEAEDPPLEVQNFYRLLTASEEKVNDGMDATVLQDVTHLMAFKSKYNFLNQCYNDIMMLIIDLILAKHNMTKDL
jgi:hypothetical protein